MEKELDLEQCKQIHRDMWEYVKQHRDMDDGRDRGISKRIFCEINKLRLLNYCALCEYARQQFLKNNNNNQDAVLWGENLCKYCPALWGNEDKTDSYYCEYGIHDEDCDDEELNWIISKCDDIINIKWKDEEER